MPQRARHLRNGITLIEVLATMVIVGVVLPVAMRGIAITTTLAGLTQERGEATMLAESKMSELQATGDWQYGNLSGDFGDEWPDYRWEAWVDDWDQLDLQQLHLAVMWQSRGVDREIALTTLVSSSSLTEPTQ